MAEKLYRIVAVEASGAVNVVSSGSHISSQKPKNERVGDNYTDAQKAGYYKKLSVQKAKAGNAKGAALCLRTSAEFAEKASIAQGKNFGASKGSAK